jgi:hypothetical protein
MISGNTFKSAWTGLKESTPYGLSSCTCVRVGAVEKLSFKSGSRTPFRCVTIPATRGARSCFDMTRSMQSVAPLNALTRTCSNTSSSSSWFPKELSAESAFFDRICVGDFSSASRSCTRRLKSCALCSCGLVRVTMPAGAGVPGAVTTILWASGERNIIPSTLFTI